MAKNIIFDAKINKNNMITIPEATRMREDLRPEDIVTVELTVVKKGSK